MEEDKEDKKFDFFGIWRSVEFIIAVIIIILALLYEFGILAPS
jgi:hypothetical protein